MKVTETKLKGCFIIEPRVFEDKRGYFYESVGGVYYTLEWPLKSSPPSSSSNHEDLLPSEIPPNDNAISAFQGLKSQSLMSKANAVRP